MTLIELKTQIAAQAKIAWDTSVDEARFRVEYASDPKFGDIATNVAMMYAKELGVAPRELAEQLAAAVQKNLEVVKRAEVAGPGFINLTLADAVVLELAAAAVTGRPKLYENQLVVTEYSDPNPFKVLHVGHLYTSIVGDAISRLIEVAGGQVHAVNFGGDVGLHVGRTLWAILQELGGEKPEGLARIAEAERAEWLARCYVRGTQAYEEDEAARAEIVELNKRVYEIHALADHDSPLAQIYWTGRQWSYDQFDAFYARIGSHFEKYYPESETTPVGMEAVRKQLKRGVYELSDGAVVFRGEKYGLHTRVFINSHGLPTYEGKDVGLILSKWRDYHFDRSVIITGNDIIEYMKVVLKSVEQFEPELVARSLHITHGNVKMAGGAKMSSRKGNILRATEVLEMVEAANTAANANQDDRVVLGAVKYALLKPRIGADIVFVPEESVTLEGNSGPYLQYAHARARSILAKGGEVAELEAGVELEADERRLALMVAQYGDVLERAAQELLPHYVATYLYELAQVFNRFYEANRVVGSEREGVRLRLVDQYADVLRDGLAILGVEAPDRL